MTNFETSIYKHFSLFLESNFCISPYLISFSRYAFAHMVSSLYEYVSNDTTTKNSWKWSFIFRLRMTCFMEEDRKWLPFIFVITYTEIHFLLSFILFPQSGQLNHFYTILLHYNYSIFEENSKGKIREFQIFFEMVIRRRFSLWIFS